MTDAEAADTAELRAARIKASALARAAVAGEISVEEARRQWPADEGIDPSMDALAHIYFDHFAWTAKRHEPDEDDVASVIELADLMAQGDPLDDERLRGFESGFGCSFSLLDVVVGSAVIAFVIYWLVRLL